MFSKILLPLDGSEVSEKAFEIGITLGEKLGIPVILTHIIDQSMFEYMLTPVPGAPSEMAPPIYNDAKENAEAVLKKKEESCRQRGLMCEVIVRIGQPADTILELAKEMAADLIVMGSHGRGHITGLFLGSVSYGVVQKAQNISVLVVR